MAWHRSRTVLGLLLLVALIYFLAPTALCTCGYEYHFVGTIIDAETAEPVARARVAVWEEYFDPRDDPDDWPSFSVTNSMGSFEGVFSGKYSWGYTRHAFSPFPPPRGPLPRKLDEVFVVVQLPEGEWYATTNAMTDAQQTKAAPAKRWLDLGTIVYDTSLPFPER